MPDDIIKKTRTSLYWNFGLKIPYEVFRFGISVYIARILDPRDFGIVSIATMLVFYANTFTNLGFNQALVQKSRVTSRHINAVFTVDLSISVIIGSFFYLISSSVATFFDSPESANVLKVMCIAFILNTFYELPYSLLRRELKFKVTSIIETCKEVSMSLITLLLALIGLKYWAVVWGMLIPLAVTSLVLCIKTRWYPKVLWDFSALKELLNFGVWSFIRAQLYFVTTRFDRVIVGRVYGPSVLGLYDKAKSLSQMPNESIAGHLSNVFFSTFSRMQDNIRQAKVMLGKSLLLLSIIVFPIYLGFYAVSEYFVIVLLGAKWVLAIVPLKILCVSGLFHSLSGPIGVFLTGVGDHRKYSIWQVMGACLLICICLIAVRWGVNAIAGGLLLHAILLFCVNVQLLKKKIALPWKDVVSNVLPAFFCSSLMIVCIKVSGSFFLDEVNFLNLFFLTLIGIITYVIFLLSLPLRGFAELRTTFIRDLKGLP